MFTFKLRKSNYILFPTTQDKHVISKDMEWNGNANPCRAGLTCRVKPSQAEPAHVYEKPPWLELL